MCFFKYTVQFSGVVDCVCCTLPRNPGLCRGYADTAFCGAGVVDLGLWGIPGRPVSSERWGLPGGAYFLFSLAPVFLILPYSLPKSFCLYP